MVENNSLTVVDEHHIEGLDFLILDDLKEGSVVTVPNDYNGDNTVHYDMMGIKNVMSDMQKLYDSNKKASRSDIRKILDKHRRITDDKIHDFLGRIENFKEDRAFKVIKRTEKGSDITIKLKEMPLVDKKKHIKSIVKKLMDKLTPEQMKAMIEQSIMKLNDIDKLEKVDKALDKKNPKLEGKRGCYNLTIDGIDLWLIA